MYAKVGVLSAFNTGQLLSPQIERFLYIYSNDWNCKLLAFLFMLQHQAAAFSSVLLIVSLEA